MAPTSPALLGRIVAFLALTASVLSCGPVRDREPDENVISVGAEYEGAAERLLAAGAFEITNIVHFYGGQAPYSLLRAKSGDLIVSSYLLSHTPVPSGEIRGWFLLPDNTCASLFVRPGNASRITAIELGERGKGFLPPAESLRPENLSPDVDSEIAAGGRRVTLQEEEKPPGTTFWSGRVQKTLDRLRLGDPPDAGAKGAALTIGMPLRLAAAILAAHAAQDITSGVEMAPGVNYVKGKYPRTLPCQKYYILPGNTLVIVRAAFNPLSAEQFTIQEIVVGEPGVGYPGKMRMSEEKFTHPGSLDLRELVRTAGPLHFAARIGDLGAIQDLLREGKVAINDRDREGFTPLHWAARRGKGDAVRALLRSGADVNAADADGDTALILAAGQGRPGLVELLLAHGARPDVRNRLKFSAFLAAGCRGDVETVALLLEKHHADANQSDESGFTLLHRAAGSSDAGLARVLLKHGANPNQCRSESISPLYEAATAGTVEVARLLLDAGATPHPVKANEWRPLDAVAQSGSVEIARLLIARGVKPDGPALYAASNHGHAEVVKLFLEHGADLKYREGIWNRTVLHAAHSAAVVKVLIQAGMDIEGQNKIGETPLHEAAHFAPHEVVVALLDLGADPHALSDRNKTPLQMAEDRDRPEKSEILQTLRAAMSKVRPKQRDK